MKTFRLIPLFFLLFASILSADEGEVNILPKGQVHKGDYFITGSSVEISGVVTGDVYAFASQVIIDGVVEGDVISSGGTIHIGGEVRGNLRLAAGQVELDGKVGRNATIMGGSITLAHSSQIDGNAVLGGGNVELAGKVGGTVNLTASNGRVSGNLGGNLKAHVGKLRLTSKATIEGDLDYSSSEEALIDSGASVRGEVVYHPSAVQQFVKGKWKAGMVLGSRYIGLLMNFLYSFVLGWILLKLFFPRVKGSLSVLDRKPWKAFWVGVLTTLLLPLAVLVLFVTILGFPFALALVAIGLIGFYAAKIFPILWISNKIFPRFRFPAYSLWTLFFGLLVFFLLIQFPIFGRILSLVASMLGIGSMILGRVSTKISRGQSHIRRKS